MHGYEYAEYNMVHVFFHKYWDMAMYKMAYYNHFASLIPVCSKSTDTLLTLNAKVKGLTSPWWLTDGFGATVIIACEFKTSSILPPMIIFAGVYGA